MKGIGVKSGDQPNKSVLSKNDGEKKNTGCC